MFAFVVGDRVRVRGGTFTTSRKATIAEVRTVNGRTVCVLDDGGFLGPEELEMRDGYELFYSSGGHGGPYSTYADALDAARRRLKGCQNTTDTISIVQRSNVGIGGYGRILEKVRQEEPAEVPAGWRSI